MFSMFLPNLIVIVLIINKLRTVHFHFIKKKQSRQIVFKSLTYLPHKYLKNPAHTTDAQTLKFPFINNTKYFILETLINSSSFITLINTKINTFNIFHKYNFVISNTIWSKCLFFLKQLLILLSNDALNCSKGIIDIHKTFIIL